MIPTAAQAESWLQALADRMPERRWLRYLLAALLFSALVFPFVWSQLTQPGWVRLIDFNVYREAGQHVLSGGGDLYTFITVPLLLPFTYPPFPALLATGLAVLPEFFAGVLWTVAELAVVVWISAVVFRPVLRRTAKGRPFLLAALAAAAFWLLPVRDGVKFGQVDIFMVGLALADCVTPRPRWPRGLLVGIATAVKLTPGLFVPYLWLTGRRKAAYVAVATFAVAQGLAQLVIPAGSRDYWTRALFASDRLGSNSGTSNESIRGMLLRLHTNLTLTQALWVALVLVVLVIGGRRALAAHRAGDEVAAVALVGLLSVAVSPVSWIHHITWVILVVAVLADDFSDARSVSITLLVTVFLVLRLPWWGNALAMHHSSLSPVRLLQDSYGLAVLALIFWMPWRPRPGAVAAVGGRSRRRLRQDDLVALDSATPASRRAARPVAPLGEGT